MTMKRIRAITTLIAVVLSLAACGGGELPNDMTEEITPAISNLPPIAIIVANPEHAALYQPVSLDGSASTDPDGDEIVGFAWSQVAGESIAIDSADQAAASFTAPGVATTITVQLIVTDSVGNQSAPATADIVVSTGTPVDYDVPLTAVFVSASAGSDDPSQSGTYLHPVATIGRGVQIAFENSLADIYVMEGTYEEEVSPASDQNLRGCVASVDADGNISYATSNATTVIKAPAGSQQAISVSDASNVAIECFTVEGGTAPDKSMGAFIKNSQSVSIANVSFTTPGAAGAVCRDVSVEASDGVSIGRSSFANSGNCSDYVGVDVGGSDAVTISDDDGASDFTFTSGSELYLKAVQAVDSDSVEVTGAQIADDGSPIANGAVFTAITLGDTTNAVIEDNDVSVEGGMFATGVSLRCTAIAVHYTVEHNTMELAGASDGVTGVRANCPVPYGRFDIFANRFFLKPADNQEMPVKGVEISAQMRPLIVTMTNNIVVMPLADSSDKADKSGLDLVKPGIASEVSVLHNTFIMLGNQGEMAAIRSDGASAQFSAAGNVIFVYGANADNAAFSIPKACQTNYCAKEVVANLINEDFFVNPLYMAYYYDTDETELLTVVNECDLGIPPAQCISGDVDHTSNVIDAGMVAPYFDLDSGLLFPTYQALAVDLGPLGTGVTADIDGTARDALPDIGATEY